MRPITPTEILDLIDTADHVGVHTDNEIAQATWFSGPPDEADQVVDSDVSPACCVTLDDLGNAMLLEDGSVRLEDDRRLVFYRKVGANPTGTAATADFPITIGDGYCVYSYTLKAPNSLSIAKIAEALADATEGSMSQGKLVKTLGQRPGDETQTFRLLLDIPLLKEQKKTLAGLTGKTKDPLAKEHLEGILYVLDALEDQSEKEA